MKGGMRNVKIFRQISLITLVPFDLERPNSAVWRDVFLGGHPRLHRKGTGPSAPNFGGFFLNYAYTLRRRTTKFDVVTGTERLLVLSGQPVTRPRPKGGASALPDCWLLLYLRLYTPFSDYIHPSVLYTPFSDYIHPLVQNDHVPRGRPNMCGRRVYLEVSRASYPKMAELQRSPILGVLLYLCMPKLTPFNAERPNSAG